MTWGLTGSPPWGQRARWGRPSPRRRPTLRPASPHYAITDTSDDGVAIVDVRPERVTVRFLLVADVRAAEWDGSPRGHEIDYDLGHQLSAPRPFEEG